MEGMDTISAQNFISLYVLANTELKKQKIISYSKRHKLNKSIPQTICFACLTKNCFFQI